MKIRYRALNWMLAWSVVVVCRVLFRTLRIQYLPCAPNTNPYTNDGSEVTCPPHGEIAVRYSDFETLIHRMAGSASPAACRSFALDTLNRLHACSREAISEEFTEAERTLLDEILGGLEQRAAEILKQKLEELSSSQCRDPIRAIEFNPKTTDLLCAIDSWIAYRITCDPEYIARIAINMVNALDYDIEGIVAGVLAAPEMLAEYDRQRRLLAGPAAEDDTQSRTPGV